MSLIEKVAERCCTNAFEKVFDEFAKDNAYIFMDVAESKIGEDVEHKHEYQACHERYLKLFEDQISELIDEEEGSIDEFYQQCREAADGEFTALFEEHRYAWFVQHLLASMEYQHFYGLMVNEARRISRK